ncbi:protein kinase domain-containing protein [Dulcicalothrix desertica]|uniref:protein kinase domain-containing protein n=1 Tax=Dulcicalothrix desertica TaxID=32056 RepID=UPI00119AD633|nr:ankyrin repeat domain-containing protein [Dulcicalothrix desertica]TWH43701.1 serine/threonine protein kinase [Dulcicalothrix desertica PCC 7102]
MRDLPYQQGDIITAPEGIRYRVIDVLGEGSSGVTFAVEDVEQPGNCFALKVLSFKKMSDWKVLELFEREAKVLAKLQHQGIPRYYDSFCIDTENDRQFCIVQELAKGKSLATWIESGWRPKEAAVKDVAEQILEILIYLHELEPWVIHRDIKPNNIIRDDNGLVFLVDFGAVRDTYYTTMMHGSTVVGTFGYIAPEQFRGTVSPTSDLYGLAATLLFLLTCRSPTELPAKGLSVDFRSKVQISDSFANWLEKMLAPDPNERFSSAREALDVLRNPQKLLNKKTKFLPAIILTSITLVVGSVSSLLMSKMSNKENLPVSNTGNIANMSQMAPSDTCDSSDKLREYVQQGLNPNARIKALLVPNYNHSSRDRQKSNTVPLIFCADNEDAKFLLKRGANFNIPESGNLILYKLQSSQTMELVNFLLDNGANPNNKIDGARSDSLLVNLMNRNEYRNRYRNEENNNNLKEVLNMVIKHGANVNALDNNGTTALMAAIINQEYHREEIIKTLIDKGADVNLISTERETRTPLHLAIQENNENIVKLLIKSGANVNAKDSSGNTPIITAFNRDQFSADIIKLLLEHGADVNTMTKDGQTLLDIMLEKYVRYRKIVFESPQNDIYERSSRSDGRSKYQITKIKEAIELILAKNARTTSVKELNLFLDDKKQNKFDFGVTAPQS